MDTPNDQSHWRCPECGKLMKECDCDDDDAEWQDRFIESDFEEF